MSSCSDAAQQLPDRMGARILRGIAKECSLLGNEIADIGDCLSAGTKPSAHGAELQSFDRLSQTAHALARLAVHLARLSLDHEFDVGALNEQVDEIPLAAVRDRMRSAIAGRSAAPEPERDDGIVLWVHQGTDKAALEP